MRILHTSDLHGNWRLPLKFEDFDVWVDCGDYLPNISRGESIEPKWQKDWFTMRSSALRKRYMPWIRKRYEHEFGGGHGWYPPTNRQPPEKSFPSVGAALVDWLGGRPVVTVGGNHDFTSLCRLLKAAGHGNVADVTAGPVELGGHRFAGFREIDGTGLIGEWVGESDHARQQMAVEWAMTQDPDILVTHSPPAGILDGYGLAGNNHAGIGPLTTWLSYRPHRVRLHLFGHVHERGGMTSKEMGILFSNAAQTARIIEVP